MFRVPAQLFLASIATAALVACQSVQTTQGGVVGVNRAQNMIVSQQEMDQASVQEYGKMMQTARAKGLLNTNPAMTARVKTIAQRLIAQTGNFRPDAPRWAWEVNVISNDQVNAFCMSGGKIAVYSGLIQKIQPTDAELAAVIGHEMAHALREHVREQVSAQQAQTMGLQLGGAVLGAALGRPELAQQVNDIGGSLVNVTFGLPRSRTAEVEADEMGTELAARAGYDPRAAITLWQKMNQLSEGRPPEFLSTHPSSQSRQADLTRVAGVVMPLYQRAGGR